MESHKEKYDIVQNPEDSNDTSVCIFLKEGSIPTTSAPSLAIGSDSNPPPHPISRILISLSGVLL